MGKASLVDTIKVLLVDDHELVRHGIIRLLSDVPGIKVIGEANTGEEGVKLAKELQPDVVLMDIQMPGMGGLEATRRIIRQHHSDIRVIALTAVEDERYASHLLEMGVSGYITKGCGAEEMVKAIRTVHAGQSHIRSEIAVKIALNRLKPGESPHSLLSKREFQIMEMIVHGKNVQEISDKLCLSPKTVNSYRYRMFEKLSVNNDVLLTRWAYEQGLVNDKPNPSEDM